MKNQKILTRDVLKIIGISGIILGTIAIPSLPAAITATIKIWNKINHKDLGRIITRLQKQQMIDLKEIDGKTEITITEKGKERLLYKNFENLKIEQRRDRKWRIIIFDIPEQQKRNRDAFRKKLLQLGCVKLQESVFVCAYPCQKEIDFLCHYLAISDYVTVFVSDKVERGQQIKFLSFYSGYNDTL